MQQPWRGMDLVIPPIAATSSSPTRSAEKVANSPAMTVRIPNHLRDVMVSSSRTRTPMCTLPGGPTLTEERKTIQERRSSTLKGSGSFFPWWCSRTDSCETKVLEQLFIKLSNERTWSFTKRMAR